VVDVTHHRHDRRARLEQRLVFVVIVVTSIARLESALAGLDGEIWRWLWAMT
jgi:hypothetical protein